MDDLTAFQRDILYVVSGMGSPKGLAIKRKLGSDYQKEINHGRLYPNLDELVEKGLLNKGSKDRRTNEYNITARGQREIKARRKWEDDVIDPTVVA